MGVHDGSHKILNTNDEYIKKREDIDMHNRRIDNLKTICMTDSTSNLNYAINMNCLLNYSYVNLCQTLLWEQYQKANAFYNFPRGGSNELIYDQTTRKISRLKDQSLSQDDAIQSDMLKQPVLCDKNERVNNRYYIKFTGSELMLSDIDLNPASGADDIVNIFIIYKISIFSGSYWTQLGVCGHDDSNFDKFISYYNQNLLISGTTNDYILIGNNGTTKAKYKNKANASELNKWICLSIHWNLPTDTSYVYINGQLITDFTSRTSPGSTKLCIGDLNPSSIAPFYGSIASFLLYKGKKMEIRDILLHHHVFCSQWFNIDHEPITF